jgi:hypothetical protein
VLIAWNVPQLICNTAAFCARSRRQNGAIRVNYYDSPWVRLLLVKTVWCLWRIVVPLLVFGVPLSTFLVLFFVAEFASGYWLAFNFQVVCRVEASSRSSALLRIALLLLRHPAAAPCCCSVV